MRIGGDKRFRSCIEVREVTASATGNGDLLTDAFRVFDYEDSTATFSCFDCAKESCCTAANDDYIEMGIQRSGAFNQYSAQFSYPARATSPLRVRKCRRRPKN